MRSSRAAGSGCRTRAYASNPVPATPPAVDQSPARGRSQSEADKILADARAVAEAGAFALVIEGVVEPIAVAITEAVACPTIGIGASAQCDGQVLVAEDMLGLFERTPRFVKRFGDMAGLIGEAAATYADDVRGRRFPTGDQVYAPKE